MSLKSDSEVLKNSCREIFFTGSVPDEFPEHELSIRQLDNKMEETAILIMCLCNIEFIIISPFSRKPVGKSVKVPTGFDYNTDVVFYNYTLQICP